MMLIVAPAIKLVANRMGSIKLKAQFIDMAGKLANTLGKAIHPLC